MSQSIKEEYSFIGYLQGLLQAKDRSVARAAMARLRCGLGKQPGTVYEMDRYVLSKLPEKADEEAYYLVAALFAYWHQGKDKAILGGSNFGRSLQLLRDSYANEDTSPGTFEEKREKHAKRLEKRLNALLAANREDLPQYLRHTINLLKSREVPVNWTQLLYDIQRWDSVNRFVQHAWAKGFWIDNREPKEPLPTTEPKKE